MNRHDFIDWLLTHYNTPESSFESLFNKYNNGLLDNLNYDFLKNDLEKKFNFLPEIKEINNFANKNLESDDKCEALIHIKRIKNLETIEMIEFDENLKNKIRSFLLKYGKKPAFDK